MNAQTYSSGFDPFNEPIQIKVEDESSGDNKIDNKFDLPRFDVENGFIDAQPPKAVAPKKRATKTKTKIKREKKPKLFSPNKKEKRKRSVKKIEAENVKNNDSEIGEIASFNDDYYNSIQQKNKIQFNPLAIQPFETTAIPEFFTGSSTKTPARYQLIRNKIVNMWNNTKPLYLSKSKIRQLLKSCGDVNSVGRIHDFLEENGWINSGRVFGKYIRTKQSHSVKERDVFSVTHVEINNATLLLMDLHCRLFENCIGLISGTSSKEAISLSEIFPLNTPYDYPSTHSVVAVYHGSDVVVPKEFEESFKNWEIEIIYNRTNSSFRFITKDGDLTEVAYVEVNKAVPLKESNPIYKHLIKEYCAKQL
ncbi:SWIRM domain-containing protein [Entamoeba marina]